MGWTVLEVLNWTTAHFARHDIPNPRLDAEVLLADALDTDRVHLYTSFDKPLSARELAAFKQRVKRRSAREPVAYIVGRKPFWSTEFEVGPGCLIPRPDTETLVEEALRLLRGGPRPTAVPRRSLPWSPALALPPNGDGETAGDPPSNPPAGQDRGQVVEDTVAPAALPALEPDATAPQTSEPALVLDLCTGAANIPICLALETGCRVIGVDTSPRAVRYAKTNVAKHGLEDRVAIVLGDLVTPVPSRFRGRFDLLTSNPPYLTPEMLARTEPEIRQYEPQDALLGGKDGLDICRRILELVDRWVAPGGRVLIEIGSPRQARELLDEMSRIGLVDTYTRNDLSGQARVVVGRKPGECPAAGR